MSQQQLRVLLQMFKSRPVVENPSFKQSRAEVEQLASFLPVEADIICERTQAGRVTAEWVTAPGADSRCALLYLHGGGYVSGSIRTHRGLAARLSRAGKARVLLLDYRLAPEHPYPAALEDSVAAYRWMLGQGLSPARIVVAGDSAGGGLTVASLIAFREANIPLPAAGVCLSPWVDLEASGDSMKSNAGDDPIIQKQALLSMAAAYLGGKNPRTPLAAPLYADLSGLPPLLIQVGTAETLLDDASRLAERASNAGVKVIYEPWEGMIHIWQLFAPLLDEGQQAIERIGSFFQEYAH